MFPTWGIKAFLLRTLATRDQLVLPLHGWPALMSAEAEDGRRAVNKHFDRFIERGRTVGSICADVNVADIILFTAIITHPLPHGLDW